MTSALRSEIRNPKSGPLRRRDRAARGRPKSGFRILLSLLIGLAASLLVAPASAQDESPFTRLFDMAEPFSRLLQGEARLQPVPEDEVTHDFSGAALMLNDKLGVVVGRQGEGIQVWSRRRFPEGSRSLAKLGHAATLTEASDRPSTIKIIQNTASSVALEVGFEGGRPAALQLRLTTGEAILGVQSKTGGGFVEVLSPTRYLVVPDYFADDVVYDPAASRGLFLPAENFLLSLLDGGEVIMMTVWQSGEQEAWLSAPVPEAQGQSSALRVRCLPAKNLWLAFMQAPGLWHRRSAPADDGWKPPFLAKWRASCLRQSELADSWDLEQGPTAAQRAPAQAGTLLFYPLDRTTATPLTATCPTDVMRNTLGVGPCQYLLACEGLAAQGDPTPNTVMGWVEKQFEQKRDRKAGDEIKERLEFMAKHVADARARIGRYARFAAQLRRLIAEAPGPFLAIAEDLERAAAAGESPAASPDRARQLAGEVAALVGQTNALPAVQRAGLELRAIGAAQDRALARCRMDVRRARQQARALALDPSTQAGPVRALQQVAEETLLNK
jgi:hypothetical protein